MKLFVIILFSSFLMCSCGEPPPGLANEIQTTQSLLNAENNRKGDDRILRLVPVK